MGYVYLIGSPQHGWYKIGKSTRPDIRSKELGILLPFEIHTIALWKSDRYSFLETYLHERFVEQRINGEWFSFDVLDLQDVFAEMTGTQRILPLEISSVKEYLMPFISIQVKLQKKKSSPAGRHLAKMISERMYQILEAKGLDPTSENKKAVRERLLSDLKLSRDSLRRFSLSK